MLSKATDLLEGMDKIMFLQVNKKGLRILLFKLYEIFLNSFYEELSADFLIYLWTSYYNLYFISFLEDFLSFVRRHILP